MNGELVAGVVGAGVFGGHHAQKYATIEGVRLAAICDLDLERAKTLAGRFGAEAYRDLGAFLDAVQIVTVAAPASAHFALAAAALKAGKDVLVEKPIAARVGEAAELISLAARYQRVLQIGHQERFVAEAIGLFDRPKRPKSVTCVRINAATLRGADVSVVLDLMIHDLDLVRALGLGEPKSISARGDRDRADATFTFAGGATARFVADRRAAATERVMTLDYDDGKIEIDFVKRTVSNSTPRALRASFENEEALAITRDPLGYGVRKFVEAARSRSAPAIPGEAGRDALRWADLIENALAPTAAAVELRKAIA